VVKQKINIVEEKYYLHRFRRPLLNIFEKKTDQAQSNASKQHCNRLAFTRSYLTPITQNRYSKGICQNDSRKDCECARASLFLYFSDSFRYIADEL
jgi:hypothetical protein